MKLSIKKFADIVGVSVRTLHYYDEIGLLKPDFIDDLTGYRYYGETAFSKMQEILFYRELDFSLSKIKEFISSPDYDKKQALNGQKHLLMLKKQRIERIIKAIEEAEKGDITLSFNEFNETELQIAREQYRAEVVSRWGETDAFKESEMNTADYTANDWSDVEKGLNAIIAEFAVALKANTNPADEKTKLLVEKLKDFIIQSQYTCTNEILSALGEMYVTDERFKSNINKAGDGTAEFMCEAIRFYCESK